MEAEPPSTAGAPWGFYCPTRIHFGVGARMVAVELAAEGRTLIVASRRGRARFESDSMLDAVAGGDVLWFDDVETNPSLSGLARLQNRPDLAQARAIVAFGGGSSMDSAKAISAILACRSENVGLRDIIARPSILDGLSCPPVHCIPTTSGTGAEVTPFATIWDQDARKKLSLNHPALYPATALVDPALTLDLPKDVTISTGLDALNQAFESVWNRNASPYTLRLAGLAIGKAMRALPVLSSRPDDLAARSAMAEASLLAGVCISQTRTALCHSISYPLTAHFGLSHGLACAFSMKAVADAVRQHAPQLLDNLAPLAGFASTGTMLESLSQLLDDLNVRELVLQNIGDPARLTALSTEMITPGRSDNFVLSVDLRFIQNILSKSAR